MANAFEVKYLWEIFPHTDFTEEYIVCEEMVEKFENSDNQATEDKWGDIRDSTNRQRIIQTVVIREYEAKFIVSRNVTPAILGYAEYITITTTDNDTFQVYDVNITYNKQPEGRNYIVELTFKRADNNIINHLSSDNVLAYKTATAVDVNEIGVTVDNPPFAFTTIEMIGAGSMGTWYLLFELKSDESLYDLVYDAVSVDDYFYCHVPSYIKADFDIYECYVESKTSSYVRFRTNLVASEAGTFDNVPVVLDFEPSDTISENVEGISYSYIIYTFISPIKDNVVTPIAGNNNQDATEENQKINVNDLYIFKVWLKTSELWKMEYINYALQNDITFTEEGIANVLVPSEVKDIYKIKENRALIGLYEFDIEFPFNQKVVSIYR